jgi:6-phosphogluconolactonase
MTLPNKLMLAAALGTTLAVNAAPCERLYIGTHQPGGAPSLFTAGFDASDGSFGPASAVAAIERPSWLVKDPARPILYAVSETGNDGASHGKVFSLRITPGTGALTEIGSVDSGGGGPTHLDLDVRSNTLLVANYGTGQAATLDTGAGGALAGPASVVQDQGTGPTPRQSGPHAHGVNLDPSRQYALVTDLGADRVFVYRFDAATRKLAPAATPFLQLAPGSGPRHLVFSADGRSVYVLAELTGALHVYAWDAAAGTLQAVQTVSTLSAGYQGKISAGEIIVSPDGKHVYVSNRGDDTIVAYQAEARSGRLAEMQRLPSAGTHPAHLALSPDGRWLLVANELTNALTSFRVGGDGRLAATDNRLDVPKPVNIVFAGACTGAPAAYRESPIQLDHGGAVKGTLALPAGGAPAPVVLLVAEGPADADGSLRQLAQALAAEGIASLRYDRRGVAGLAVEQHADDAAAWIELLKKDARFNKVVVVGHGEGVLAGLLAANKVGANGFVSLAGSGARTAAEFGKLKMHARIIQGGADLQVGMDEVRRLEQARPGTPVAVIAGMNHALKVAQGELPVAPELVAALVGFISKR